MKKGTYGYIKDKKIKLIIYLLLTIAIALTIYFIGYFVRGRSRENIATIFAVLWVLPGAKIIVSLALVMPHKGLKNIDYEKVQKAAGHIKEEKLNPVLYDLVLTSQEKVMRIKALAVTSDKYIVLPCPKQDIEHLRGYIGKHMLNYGFEKEIVVIDTVDDFIIKIKDSEPAGDNLEKLISKLMILEV